MSPGGRMKTRTFPIGSSNRIEPSIQLKPLTDNSGFTLIELGVVILLISVTLFFVAPRIPNSPLTDQSRKTSRWIMTAVADLKDRAVRDQKTYTLHVSLDANRLWVTHEAMSDEEKDAAQAEGMKLSGAIRLMDVEYPGNEKITAGRAEIRFYPKGYSDRALLHAKEGERRVSYQIEPFLSRVIIHETYTGFGG